MTVEWDVPAYKARLDAAIAAERWDEVDRVRIAAKHRLIEVIAQHDGEQASVARDALADSFQRIRLGNRIRIQQGPLATATKLLADGETAGFAADTLPLPAKVGRGVRENVLLQLGNGNKRPMTTTELSEKTGHRLETIARAVGQLRAQGKIVSRRMGRHVLHCLIDEQSPINEGVKLKIQANRSPDDTLKIPSSLSERRFPTNRQRFETLVGQEPASVDLVAANDLTSWHGPATASDLSPLEQRR